jgi:hypothetical protein
MPVIKKNKLLDSGNSIYSASRKVAARQLKNMIAPALDDGETSQPQNPIPTNQNTQDYESLIPQLLQNVSDINGLMMSLKLVGGKSVRGVAYDDDDDDDGGDQSPRKRPRGGRRRRIGGARKEDDIEKLQEKIRIEVNRKELAEREIKKLDDTPPPKNASDKEYRKSKRAFYKNEITKAKLKIRRYLEKIDRLERGEEAPQDLPPAPAPDEFPDEGEEEEYPGGGGGGEGPAPVDEQPRGPIINPALNDDVEDYEGDGDDFLDISQFDFSKVGKSTLLVILNQLKSLVKRGDILLKKIVHSNIVASEGDLDTLVDELSDIKASKKFLLDHIIQISRKGKQIAEYLHSILTRDVGKFIDKLKTYIKRYAQLGLSQINSIKDDDEQIEPVEVVGAGRSVGHPVILSDVVRRIHSYDKKYLL